MTEKLERLCDVCGNLGFIDGGDGFFYCTRCNSQASDFIDTGVDDADLNAFDGGIYSAFQTRARPRQEAIVAEQMSQLKASQSQYQEILKTMDDYNDDNVNDGVDPTDPSDFGSFQDTFTSPDYYYSELRKKYVMGVQIMIQLQCKALVEKFNVSPLIVGLTGPIWLRYLAYEGVMADEWADNVIHESESQTQGEIGEFKPVAKHKAEPHNLLGKRAIPIWHRSLRSKVPLSCSLAISFLVCHMVREAVLPTDIVKWMVEGKLPYFAAFLEIQKQLGPSSRAFPISASYMFRPTQAISIQKLESFAASIGRRIGLELPPVNFHAIASRYLRELSLPVEKILPQACRVYGWSMPPELYLSDNESRLPSRVCVMSIVIVTIRIMYDLNGGKWEMMLSRRSDRSPSINMKRHVAEEEDFDMLDEEADFDALGLLQILETKYSEHKDIYDYAQDLPSYLQYCKDVVFAGINSCEDHEEESLIEVLWDFYQKNKDVEPSDGLKNSMEFQGGGSNHGTTEEDDANSPGDNESLHEGQYLTESYKDRAIRQLKSNMEENRFCYIPPSKHTRKRKYGYIRYARKKDGAYIYAAHADYYILLRSCAQIAQVDVRTMHHGVLTFQKRLEELDKRIDYCLHWKPPGDFCDFCCD